MADNQQAEMIQTVWREVSTVVVDGVVGTSHAGGLQRVVLGQVAFNPLPGATLPSIHPVVAIALTQDALRNLVQELTALLQNINE